jgi:2'-5' RNA ligase
VSGTAVAHPSVSGLPLGVATITETPRKYGFHGTVKPPFRLAGGTTAEELHEATRRLCETLAPIRLEGLALHRIGGFLALTPVSDQPELGRLAARVVEGLDRFRAPPDAAEIARRAPERLSTRQRSYLELWGYPYVMEEFRFHLTLTGDLPEDQARATEAALAPVLAPMLPSPFRIDSLCLFGQGADGLFRLLHRYALSG